MTLWAAADISLDDLILAFTVGDDPELDRELLPYDCLGSAAHATMLAEIGVLSSEEGELLLRALRGIWRRALADEIEIDPTQEDCHTALEELLTAEVGEAGKKIHTGRSRNDQVVAALRLLIRDRGLDLSERGAALGEALIDLGARHAQTLMPGYTHTRQAMPSTVGQLLFSTAEGLLRDLESLELVLQQANRSALGAASGFGVPLPLDRARVAELLGYDAVDQNTIYVQNTRGKLEATTLFALHQMSLTLSRFATDLIWFSSEAFQFFQLPVELTTGSSIMPQKRNPDVFELVRAVPASMLARYTETTALQHGLPAGYHRDLQRTKSPLLIGLAEMSRVLAVMLHATERLEVNVEHCAASMRDEIYLTDQVYALVRGGSAFRDAYREVKERGAQSIAASTVLESRTHLGAPGTDQAEALRAVAAAAALRRRPFLEGAQTARALLTT